jgi:hypothetical protein
MIDAIVCNALSENAMDDIVAAVSGWRALATRWTWVTACALMIANMAIGEDRWGHQTSSAPTPPPTLAAASTSTPPVIDGKLDDPAWQSAAQIENLNSIGGGAPSVQTLVRVTWDQQALYVGFDCEEPQMDRLRVKAQAGEDKWPGDCVEVFLDVMRSEKRFVQFVTNSRGARNAYHEPNDAKWRVASAITPRGWSAEYAIPWSDFAIDGPTSERYWGFNVTRERELEARGDALRSSEMMTWAPMLTFGNPKLYGSLFFGSEQRMATQGRPLALRAVLDKHRYISSLHPVAHLAVEAVGVRGRESAMQVQVLDQAGLVCRQSRIPLTSSRMGVDVPVEGLAAGSYTVAVQVAAGENEVSRTTAALTIVEAPPPPRTGSLVLRQSRQVTRGVDRWHVCAGVPFPEGVLLDPNHVQLLDAQGRVLPLAAQTLATWSRGGSVKWLALNFQLPLQADARQEITLKYGPQFNSRAAAGLTVEDQPDLLHIDTGAARFTLRKRGFNFIDEARQNGRTLWRGDSHSGAYMVDDQGLACYAALDQASEVVVEETSPLHAVVRAKGWHVSESGRKLGQYVTRLYFYANLPYVRAQHTFIITEDTNKVGYRDIALALPISGNDYRMGVNEGAISGGGASLVQKRWDQFVVLNGGQALQEGDKAPGILGRGEVAVVVRDFWQNFPKELQATPQQLRVHFWPEHGQRVWSPQDEIQPQTAYLLPWVHQGDVLKFQMPQSYIEGPLAQQYGFAYPDNKGGWKLHYGDGAQKANALGLAKTHDMLIALGAASQGPPLDALHEAFQQSVHFLPDPAWTCATRVAGDMAPADPQQYPRVEDKISQGFDHLVRWTWDMTHGYGMFNYGDSYHVANRDDPNLLPNYYRLWAGFHHGRARIPWLFYLRSGDPKYLDWARANTQHLMDIDTCHYTTAEARRWPSAARKEVGGMCDYKGIVHWHSGDRVSDYNNMVDFLQWDYYLTGNVRALDVMEEIGALLVQQSKGSTGREACNLGALLHYYLHSWDPGALLTFTAELPRCYEKPAVEHEPPSVQWGPYLEPWIEHSDDPQAKKFLLQLADDVSGESWRGVRRSRGQYYGDGRVLAMAYQLTGDRKYLALAWGFYNRGPGLFDVPGHPLRHYSDWLDFSFETQQCLPVMAKVAALQQPLTREEIDWTNGRGLAKIWMRSSADSGELKIVVPETTDQAFAVGNRFFTRKNLQYELIDPRGKVVKQGAIETSANGLHVEQPADGITGDYTLRVFGPDEFQFEGLNLSSLGTQRIIVPDTSGSFHISGVLFFVVPEGCEKFSITTRGVNKADQFAVAEIVDPEGRIVQSVSMPGLSDVRKLEVVVPAGQRGKVWSLVCNTIPILGLEGIEPWFATSVRGAELGAEAKRP